MSVFIFITVLLEIDNPAAAPVDAGPRISRCPPGCGHSGVSGFGNRKRCDNAILRPVNLRAAFYTDGLIGRMQHAINMVEDAKFVREFVGDKPLL
jgi:hypothetical protein